MALAAKHESHPQFMRMSDAVNAALYKVARDHGINLADLEREATRLDRGVDALVGALLNALDSTKTRAAMVAAMNGERG